MKDVTNKYESDILCAVTGSFDPFTKGHRYVVEKALERFDKVVVVIAINPDKRRLFTLSESAEIARASLSGFGDRVKVDICHGLITDYCNEHDIRTIIRGYRNEHDLSYEKKMGAYNFKNGGVSTYLIEANNDIRNISATKAREALKEQHSSYDNICETAKDIVRRIMKNKIDKDKIIQILSTEEFKDNNGDLYFLYDKAEAIADALVAHSIGDIKIWEEKYAELEISDAGKEKRTTDQHNEIRYLRDRAKQAEKERDEWKRRADVAERNDKIKDRALDKATELAYEYRTEADTLSCSSCPMFHIFDSCKERGLYKDCSKRWKEEILRQSEREIEEERK